MIPIHTPQDLGKAVRTTRKRLRMTQAELSLVTGVGLRFIVELEAGKPTLRLQNVMRVIDALGGELAITGLGDGHDP